MQTECYADLMQSLRGLVKCALLFSVCFAAFAQQEDPTFKTQSRLVVVPVTVATKAGLRVWDLKAEDFTLLDNGQSRKITVEPWGTYDQKVSMVVVVETSYLSEAALIKISKVASSVSNITGEDGEIAVITADAAVHSVLDFTKEWEPLHTVFEKLHASTERAGHVLDAVSAGIVLLEHRPPTNRRIVLVFSENVDRGSHARPIDVLTFAEKENVIIYTVNYSAFLTPFTVKGQTSPPMSSNDPRKAKPTTPVNSTGLIDIAPAQVPIVPGFGEMLRSFKFDFGKALAEYTGGRQLNFTTLDRLDNDLNELSVEVHSQYQISFVPPQEKDPIYHEIEVQVNHPELVVRARPGYWIGVPVEEKKPEPPPTSKPTNP